MTQVAETVYSGGVLKPTTPLQLRECQVVRIIVEALDAPEPASRAAAWSRLESGIERMNFTSSAPYPSRDEFHDRL